MKKNVVIGLVVLAVLLSGYFVWGVLSLSDEYIVKAYLSG
jgi:hypothetical protein